MPEPSPASVRCSNCDTPFNDETLADVPIEDRPACPNCGSKTRIISLTFAVTSQVSPHTSVAPPAAARMAIPPETAELECNVRVMHLSGGAFSVEISDPAGDDPVAAVGLSADDLALGIAEDIARRIKTSRGD